MSEHECPKCLCGPCMCHVPNEVLKGAAKKLNIGAKAEELYTKLEEIRTILSCRSGETVVEAAKRWRETMEEQVELWELAAPQLWETDSSCHRVPFMSVHSPIGKARECIGGEK